MRRASLVVVILGVAASSYAQSWLLTAGSGSWTNTANWNPAAVPDSDTASVVMSQNFTNSPATPTLTLDRAAAFTVNKISYSDTVATYYGGTISAGAPAGSLIFAGTAPTVDTPGAAGSDLTITAPVNLSAAGLTKTGTQNVFLNGAVTGFGPLVYNSVNAGMLVIGPATTVDWTTINKASGGGILRIDAPTMTASATCSVGAGQLLLNPSSGTFGFNAAGFTKSGAGSLYFNRVATGPGGDAALQVNGGVLIFTASLSGFASGSVASGDTLQFIAPSSSTLNNAVPLTLNGNGAANTLEFPANNSSTYNMVGIALTNDVIIRGYGLADTYNFANPITSGGVNSLTFKSEGGNQASNYHTFGLNAASTYTGNTTFNALTQGGYLKLGVANALPVTTVLTLIGGGNANTCANLELNGKNQALAGLAATPNSGGARVINSSGTASTLTITNTSAATFSGLIGITGKANLSLVKQGLGALTLSGTNAYSGGTTVSGGSLLVNNTAFSGTGSGSVTVNSGATLAGSGIIQGGITVNGGATLSGTLTAKGASSAAADATLAPGGIAAVGALNFQNTLTLNSSRITFDVKGNGTNDLIALSGAGAAGVLTLNGTNTIKLNLLNGTLPVGTNTLITYASTSGSGTLTLAQNLRNAALTIGATNVVLTVTGSGIGASLNWVGDGVGNSWDIGASSLWDNGGMTDVYYELDNVTFSDTGSASPDINLTTVLQPSSVTVNNTAKNYTLSGVGSLDGVMSLTKSGAGTLTLSTANTYSGNTSVGGGRLVLSGGSNRLPAATPLRFTGTGLIDLGGNGQSAGSLSMALGSAASGVVSNGSLAINGGVTVGATAANMSNGMDLRPTASLAVGAAAANLVVGGTDASATGNAGGELYLPGSAALTVSQVQIGRSGSGSAASNKNTGKVHLGQATVFQADQVLVGTTRAEGTIDLQSGLAAPTVSLRNTAGLASRVTLVTVGENGAGGTASGFGLIDLSGATLDGRVTDLVIGKGSSASTAPTVNGTFRMGDGTLDVVNFYLCKDESGGLNDNNGTFTQAGGAVKAQTLTMGTSLAASTNSTGNPVLKPTYNLSTGAVLYAQAITGGSGAFGTASVRNMNLSNGTLRNYDAATDLTVSGVAGAGGNLNLVLMPATTNTITADAGRTITLNPSAVLTNSGALVKDGPGTFTVNSVNINSGTTTVNNGTLAGVGAIAGTVYVKAGARLAPGTNTVAGILTVANLTLAAGVTNAFDCAATTNDSVTVTGNLTLEGASVVELSLGNGPVPLWVPIFNFTSLTGEEYLNTWTVQGVNQPRYASRVIRYGNSLVVATCLRGMTVMIK